MIEAKEVLIGNIASSHSLSGSLNKGIEYITPTTQEKTITPTKEQQIVVPDDGIFALSKVTVEEIPSNYTEVNGTIDITSDGEYDVKQYEKAKVNVNTTTISKGVVINEVDEKGYATDISIVDMTEIPNYFFYTSSASYAHVLNKNLQKVHFSNDLTSIGYGSFGYCAKLEEAELPDSLITLGGSAFRDTTVSLTKIPSGITTLLDYTFYNCKNLIELTCEGVITSIATNVFNKCTNFKKLVLSNILVVPTLSSTNSFTSTKIASGTGYIYVPDDLVEDFKAATNWSTYADQIKGISEL